MALSVRASASQKVVSSCKVQPKVRVAPAVSNQSMHLAGVGMASLALAAAVVAPAEAHNVVSTIASAAEGYPFVPPAWAPSVLVPITGLLFPGIVIAWAFNYIEKDAPQ